MRFRSIMKLSVSFVTPVESSIHTHAFVMVASCEDDNIFKRHPNMANNNRFHIFLKVLIVLILILCGLNYAVSFKIFTKLNLKSSGEDLESFEITKSSPEEYAVAHKSEAKKQYLQIPVNKYVFYYTPLILQNLVQRDPSYISYKNDEIGRNSILLREEPKFSPYPGKTKYVLLRKNAQHDRHSEEKSEVNHYVYDVLASKYTSVERFSESEIPYTRVTIVEETVHRRKKRSKIYDRLSETGKRLREHVDRMTGKKVIHLPALFIEEDKDGFQNVFYEELINAALCLTSQPELNRHELVDEYEVLLCNKKGYGQVIRNPNQTQSQKGQRKKRDLKLSRLRRESPPVPASATEDPDYHYHDADSAKWHMDRSKYDMLWKVEQNATTTTIRPKTDIVDYLHYDYEYDDHELNATHPPGWEDDDEVADPSDLDYMTWPAFLNDGQPDDDSIRGKYHTHDGNVTLASLSEKFNFQPVDPATVDRKQFALNETNYVSTYYEQMLKLSPFKVKPLLINFFGRREKTLSGFRQTPITLEKIRQLFILFIVDIHHVNCFNRHIRYYGYLMKKPASINGDEITNGARLARGIIMRALELLRHTPQYNIHKGFLLRLLIAGLKERAALSKTLTTIIGENDYSELYEVAVYLENLLKNGIHPDEKDQDLFVQETRFYSHHFMNTLSL